MRLLFRRDRKMQKLQNVLFITGGYPREKEPVHCTPIGYRLASLRKKKIKADVLNLKKIKFKDTKSLLQKCGFIFTLFIPVLTLDSYEFIGQRYKIFKIYYTSLSKIWLLPIVFFLVKKNKYSIFHYHFLWFTQELVFLKRFLKIPSVVTAHGSDIHDTAVRNPLERRNFKKAIEHADKIIYVSNGLRIISDKIGLATKKDIVIYNGFDSDLFPLTVKKDQIPVFGFVGHLYKVKGIDRLPEIFKNIKKVIPRAKFIVVGGGEKEHSLKPVVLKELCRYNLKKDVEFIGEVEPKELKNYYSQMDMLLLPSRNEGFGTVVVEARACGVAVVGSEAGGIPEAISTGGIVVPLGCNFEKRFANESIKLYKNLPPRRKISKEVQDLTWDKIILKEINVYKNILNKSK